MNECHADLESLSMGAARFFTQQALQAVESRGQFSVVLAGGSTPARTYELLAQPPFRDEIPWAKVHVFWGDERWVAHNDPRSNYQMARQALLDKVPIPQDQIHAVPYTIELHEAAECYEATVRTFFKDRRPQFDLVLLGLGENGHMASLFPGSPALAEQQRWVVAALLAERHEYRITMTAPLLNQAAVVVFLVAGANKAGVLHEVLEGPRDPMRLPAQLIRPTDGELYWFVDEAAAQQLQQEMHLEAKGSNIYSAD